MDLLGSILGSMEKPPVRKLSAKEKERLEKEKKMEEKQKMALKKFREKVEKEINDFLVEDSTKRCHKFPTMDKYHRTIVHEVAEIGGLVSYSFGEEDVDRHLIVWKNEFAPDEQELEARRNGIQDYDPQIAKKIKEERDKFLEEEKRMEKLKRKNPEEDGNPIEPKKNYRDKYEHLIGKDAALEAAQKTQLNKCYGMVSAESKKDRRTVEEVQAEIRAKKKAKLEEAANAPKPAVTDS